MTLCLLVISLLLIVVLCGCSSNARSSTLPLSQLELDSAAETYKNDILELCEKYGLSDAKVKVGNEFSTRTEIPNIDYRYVDDATVESELFLELKGEDAFQFAKEFNKLNSKICDEKHLISFVTKIQSGKNIFCYKYEKGLEYLLEYDSGISLITYKNGTLMHNIFDSKEYLIDLENLEQENAPNIDVPSKDVVTEYDATLVYGNGFVVVAISKEAMDSFFDALANNNKAGMQKLYKDGQIADTPSGTKVAILDSGIMEYKVKLLDGLYAGNTVWVIAEAIKKK